MSNPRWAKVRRDLWIYRGRTATVTLAIVVGLAAAGAVLNAWSLLRRVTREEYLATNPASAIIRVDSIDPALLRAVRAAPAVRMAEARRSVAATAETGGVLRVAVINAADFGEQRIGRLAPMKGVWPPAPGTFVIEKSSEEFAGVTVGDSITLRIGSGNTVRLAVSGVVRDVGVAPGWMEHVVYGFVDPATLGQLGTSSALDQLHIVLRDTTASRGQVQQVALQLRDIAVAQGHVVKSIAVPEPGEHVHAAQMNSFLMTLGAFAVMALVMSGLLVVNLVTATLSGQIREIGMMKAIGARPSQLIGMYLCTAFAFGLFACVFGIPLGIYAGKAYASFAANLLNFSVDGYNIPMWAIGAQVIAGVLLPVLSALVPVVRGSKVPVAIALRDVGTNVAGATPPWLRRIRGPQRPLLLSVRNAFRRRQRMTLTLVTLSLGGATFLGALDLRTSIRGSIDHLYDSIMRFDMMIQLAVPQSPERVLQVAQSVSGVRAAEAWSMVRAGRTVNDELVTTFAIVGAPPASALVAFEVTEGRWLTDRDTNALVVNKRLQHDQPWLKVGETVSIVIAGRSSVWRVVGGVESGPEAFAYATRSALDPFTGGISSTVIVRAASRDPDVQSKTILQVRGAFETAGMNVASTQLMDVSRRVLEDHMLLVAGFLVVMAGLTVAVGGLGLASSMSLSVLERTREIGVMRTVGATPATILALVEVEGLVVALLSWVIALPLSLPMSILVGNAFGRSMFPVPATLVPNGAAMLMWFGLVVVVSVVACAWPAWRATRISTAAALMY